MTELQLLERAQTKSSLNELNITGGVDEARKNLTTFTKDTIDDVKEIKKQLEATKDEIIDRERKLRQ